MSDGIFAESIEAAGRASGELRTLIREAHQSCRDMKDAKRELEEALARSEAFVTATMPDQVRELVQEAISLIVKQEMARLGSEVDSAIKEAKLTLERAFKRLARLYMYGTEDPYETDGMPSLEDLTRGVRASKSLLPGDTMPAAFRSRKKDAGAKPKR